MTGANRQREFKEHVGAWALKVRVRPRQVRVQRMTRKWASCSTSGQLTFAADLLEQSRRFQDYVIVHELLHLKIPNHGKVFRSLLSTHLPGWRQYCAEGFVAQCAQRKGDMV
jgi:hypothetical protein